MVCTANVVRKCSESVPLREGAHPGKCPRPAEEIEQTDGLFTMSGPFTNIGQGRISTVPV